MADWLLRSMAKQNHKAAAQLTIFYGGCVNVFDDVPFDKVSFFQISRNVGGMFLSTTFLLRLKQ